jgi:hypothetical protein
MSMDSAPQVRNFTIQGRTLSLPIEVRSARSWAATYLVDARAAQKLIEQSGLEVAEMRPGKALANLAMVRYEDTDLDAYNEVAVAFVVRLHDARPASPASKAIEVARNRTGVYIHHLPVNRAFTLEAGRTIWGYPKFMADIDVDERAEGTTCTLAHEGARVLTLVVRKGIKPWPRIPNLPTYTFLDGVLRRTPWDITQEGRRGRVGGATLDLVEHPIAEELRSLGLPKLALLTTSVDRVRATFGAAETVSPATAGAH